MVQAFVASRFILGIVHSDAFRNSRLIARITLHSAESQFTRIQVIVVSAISLSKSHEIFSKLSGVVLCPFGATVSESRKIEPNFLRRFDRSVSVYL